MFRRTKTSAQKQAGQHPASAPPKGPGAKGRPTPTRAEAQAAARERAKAGMDKKTAQKVLREGRTQSNAEIRAGMRRGDERYLPRRDQGPVRRFVRDQIDARLSVAEFLLPLLVVITLLQYSGNARLQSFSLSVWTATILLVVLDTLWLMYRLRRTLRTRFPEENLQGTTVYALMRVIQLRLLRMPKPQVKVGGAPR